MIRKPKVLGYGILAVGFMLTAGCSQYRYSHTALHAEHSAWTLDVVLLNFNAYYDSVKNYTVLNLVSLKEVKGLYDQNATNVANTYLVINQVDALGKVVASSKCVHPLFRSMEYLDDDGKFKRAMVRQQQTSFMVRMGVSKVTTGFSVEEVNQDKSIHIQYFKR